MSKGSWKSKNSDKVKPLKSILPKDREFFKALSRTGHLNKEMCKQVLNSDKNPKRVQTYLKNNIIQKGLDKNGNECYKITPKGRDYIQKNIPEINGFYNAQSIKHDLKFAEIYFNLSDTQKANFLNEYELKNYIYDSWSKMGQQGEIYKSMYEDKENKTFSLGDGAIVEYVNGIEIITVLEITTNFYSDTDIEAKIEMANSISAEIKFIKS